MEKYLYSPRDHFRRFHFRRERWVCIVAHRRAGKTVACINDLLTRALYTKREKAQYAYIAPFYVQAKQIAWAYLKYYGGDSIAKTNESELTVTLHNGSKIFLCGADNPNRLRGLYLDGCILDEYADMKPSVWGLVIRPMLADRKGWAVFIGTPKGHNAFYKLHNKSQKDKRWFSLTLKASETGILEAEELADARDGITEEEYEQEFECSFEAAIRGAVYGKWMANAHREKRLKPSGVYDPSLPVHTAWDLGYDDDTSIWWWQIAGANELRIIDFYEANRENIEHYCNVVRRRNYNYGKHYVPHDAANKLLAAGGRSIVQQAYALGIQMIVVPATSQQNAIEAARKTLEVSWFDTSTCEDGIEALKHYQFEFDEQKNNFRSTPRHDWSSHAADAFEIIGQIWREPAKLAEKQKPRFLNDMTADELFWPDGKGKSERNF